MSKMGRLTERPLSHFFSARTGLSDVGPDVAVVLMTGTDV